MPTFMGSETVRDVVIGMADGLTVPFALAAGLSAAVSSTQIIATVGMAEIVAGAIAMGLGGYLAARTDQEHFEAEERREFAEVENLNEREMAEVETIFSQYGLSGEPLRAVVGALTSDRKCWVEFMMRFELGLERPDPKRAPVSAATIAASYLVGGLIPLAPYLLTTRVDLAFQASVVLTAMALLTLGGVKGRLTGLNVVKASLQTAATIRPASRCPNGHGSSRASLGDGSGNGDPLLLASGQLGREMLHPIFKADKKQRGSRFPWRRCSAPRQLAAV